MTAATLTLLAACVPFLAGPDPVPPAPEPSQDSRPSLLEQLRREGRIWSVEELAARLRSDHERGQPTVATARTVLRGTEPVEFRVELLDVLEHFIGPRRHMIFAQITDEHPTIARAGVVSGMSGSPIALDGRLVGALAYRLGFFGKVPFIGITPIEYMLEEAERRPEEFSAAPPPPSAHGWSMVPTPLLVSGGSPRAARILEELLRATGRDHERVVVPAAQGSAVWNPPDRFVDGGTIGVLLLDGDISLAGIGTVTHVEGDLVLGFGHPMLGDGPSALPITTGVVHEIFAGMASSFKIASAGPVRGALVQDRTTAIVGRAGREPDMVSVRVTIRSDAGGEREFRFRAARDRRWLPMLVDFAVSAAADAYEPWGYDRVVRTHTTVRLRGGRSAEWEEVNSSVATGGVAFRILTGGSPLARLANNEFEDPAIEAVEVRQEFVPGNRTAGIHRAWAVAPEVAPGGTARARVQLRPWRAEDVFVDVEIPVPEDAQPGTDFSITIGGGAAVAMELPPPQDLDDLLRILGRAYRSTALVAVAERTSYRLLYRGAAIDRIPASIVAQMAPGIEEQAVLARSTLREVRDTEWVVLGTAKVVFRIREEP